jgi:gamma-glutamyl:cysteine ligase YbdK (ATP-grasp superfamily)
VTLHLGQGHGLELEYMLVDAHTLDVRAIAERVLFAASGNESGDHENGRISWSNELVRHVIELKTSAPERSFAGLAAEFQANVRTLAELLRPHGARLLPTGMHPWMDPRTETELWPFACSEVYATYDRLFDCRRHGWANLQSVHLNLSFDGDGEFARLHAALRLVLPLVPALAASTPVMEGRATGLADQRLEVYRTNAVRVPRMSGEVIPEPCFDEQSYRREILEPLQRDVAALEPEGILEGEWLNARGAIARFDRGAIELRLIDSQECPRADLAVAWACTCVVRALVEERDLPHAAQRAFASAPLAELLRRAIAAGPAARVTDGAFARALGWRGAALPSLGELWADLAERCVFPALPGLEELREPLQTILREGTLSARITRALGASPSRARLHETYAELAACLEEDRTFHAE